MAPGKSSKQSLLDLSVFLKQPSKAVLKKRKKLEKEMKPFIRGKASVDHKKKARIKREKEIEKGSREWHQFLVASGVTTQVTRNYHFVLSLYCHFVQDDSTNTIILQSK